MKFEEKANRNLIKMKTNVPCAFYFAFQHSTSSICDTINESIHSSSSNVNFFSSPYFLSTALRATKKKGIFRGVEWSTSSGKVRYCFTNNQNE